MLSLRSVFCVGILSSSVLLIGCGGTTGSSSTTTTTTTVSYATPTLSALSPSTAIAGSNTLTLTVTGTNFIQGTEIYWGSTPLATLYVSATQLQAPISVAQLASAGTIQVSVMDPSADNATASNAEPFIITLNPIPNPLPTLLAINPASAVVNAAAFTLSVTGANFVAGSQVLWNGTTLSTTYVSATSLNAQVPASDLTTVGTAQVSVMSPSPGGGTSVTLPFLIDSAVTNGTLEINETANSLAWDPLNQVLYLSLPSSVGANGNSIQILNPYTGALGTTTFVGSEPNLLSVSPNSKYLYVSLNGSSAVNQVPLPLQTAGTAILLGADSFYGNYLAMDVQASPVADGTVAVVRGTPDVSPEEEGGVVIYDNGTPRPGALCGWIQSGCVNGPGQPFAALYDSIQWKSDGSEMFAGNNEDTGFDFYTMQVGPTGFGAVTDYGGALAGFGGQIHYDATTGYIYDDDGGIINPANGQKIGSFNASGTMVPDGKAGKAYFIGQSGYIFGTNQYQIEVFDINKFVPLGTITIQNVPGVPTKLIRWGSNGLAFSSIEQSGGLGTNNTGAVFIVTSDLIGSGSSSSTGAYIPPTQNVQRSWSRLSPMTHRQAPPTAHPAAASTTK
jgi:hypothetical protein